MTQKDVGVGENAGHGTANLMAHVGQKLVFATVVLPESFFALQIRGLALGDVEAGAGQVNSTAIFNDCFAWYPFSCEYAPT